MVLRIGSIGAFVLSQLRQRPRGTEPATRVIGVEYC
jgi:hypothetical protein